MDALSWGVPTSVPICAPEYNISPLIDYLCTSVPVVQHSICTGCALSEHLLKIMARVFDIAASLVGIILLFPLFVVVALFVKLYDWGPVLYRARRVGKQGSMFDLYKFRTMVPNADRIGGGITIQGDDRVTPVGRVLRKNKLDELPQLFNVLKGDMSFVGPRPEDPRYVEHYTPEQRKVLAVSPGITSPASVRFRNEEKLLNGANWERDYVEHILPRKLAMELEYFPTRSLGGDIRIIIRTLGGLLK